MPRPHPSWFRVTLWGQTNTSPHHHHHHHFSFFISRSPSTQFIADYTAKGLFTALEAEARRLQEMMTAYLATPHAAEVARTVRTPQKKLKEIGYKALRQLHER